MKEDLQQFKTLIRDHCGLLLEGIAEERLEKALHTAAGVAGCKRLQDFFPRLQKDPELVKDLVSQLTVNETYFFRENSQFELLVKRLLPRIQALAGGRQPLRLLSAGCSSGEEAYSLVMTLQEHWGEAASGSFSIDAGDLDRQVLQKARQGLYSPFSFRGVADHLKEKYFLPQRSYFQIKDSIRQQVRFHELNLLEPPKEEDLGQFDIVFFRNVSIYFDTETRVRIQHNLARLMRPDAVLLVGSSETLANNLGVFNLVEEDGIYYFVRGQGLIPPQNKPVAPFSAKNETISAPKPVQPVRALKPVPSMPAPSPQPLADNRGSADLPDLQTIFQLLLDQEMTLAAGQVERLLAASREVDAAKLFKAWILGNRKSFQQARQLLQELLDKTPWWLDALFLQALLSRWQEDFAAAEVDFKKAVYIQPDCWPAHYYLGEVYRQTGRIEEAIKAYRKARRCIQDEPEAPTGLKLVPLNLSQADVLFLIEHQLLRLERQLAASGTEGE
ncbi:CheR family methyltransferase [Marinospirillum perlucidum]|uniref:CheR family methyltransferase n=1 Tax=Marinospirillum perlucidum TaxID=1982602 RepID=UPI000DF26AF2|nr:protein-glutamate O-methyltransferase CheR [Marinospirillum perlucidum]